MDEHQWLAERFEEHRIHLRAVAYRMLGSLSEADDAVQESWLRLSRSDARAIENLGGWLTTVVARVCLNVLRSRESRSGGVEPQRRGERRAGAEGNEFESGSGPNPNPVRSGSAASRSLRFKPPAGARPAWRYGNGP